MSNKEILRYVLDILLIVVIIIGVLSIPLLFIGLLPCSGDGCMTRILLIPGIPMIIISILGYMGIKVLITNFT